MWRGIMKQLVMNHVHHECRHTFEARLDAAGGNRRRIDLLIGHASKDVGNRIYNHKTLTDLQATIELLTIRRLDCNTFATEKPGNLLFIGVSGLFHFTVQADGAGQENTYSNACSPHGILRIHAKGSQYRTFFQASGY